MSEQVRYSVAVSVRQLVQFVMLSGSIERGFGFVGPAPAMAGILGHQHIQEGRPEGYKAEVYLKHEVQIEDLCLTVRGRVDGIWQRGDEVVIEEIKTVSGRREIAENPVHWAQCKVYAHIHLLAEPRETIDIQLTYLNRRTYQTTEFKRTFTREALAEFFEQLVSDYVGWSLLQIRWQEKRNRSIEALEFPYPSYRRGQRQFAVEVYRAIVAKSRLFAEAPTGIGKTMGAIFPSIKAIQQGEVSKIFYLTAKTLGREVAQKAFADLRKVGLHFRVVTLTAKDKICFKPNEDEACDVEVCPYAIGYYDRLKGALRDAAGIEDLTRERIEELAQRHMVCPFEFSLDLSTWADAIICDYNYAFSPKAQLKRYFDEEEGDFVLLIDEAHNLVDRARDMFSATLDKRDILGAKRLLQKASPACAKWLHKINGFFVKLRKQSEEEDTQERPWGILVDEHPPDELFPMLESFLEEAELYLLREPPAEIATVLLDLYFQMRDFLRAGSLYDKRFTTLFESIRKDARLQLYCVDPSMLLKKTMRLVKSAIFFSATLRPIDYFLEMLGGDEEDRYLELPSPFPPENLNLLIEDRVATNYRSRERTYGDVADSIARMVHENPGHTLVYFPSYRYLEEVFVHFAQRCPDRVALVQQPGMKEAQREAFLAAFDADNKSPIVGFAVMGGIFGEAIDLVGERLTGAVIVGVGLPQICLERNLIREYFEQKNGTGFEYAYVFPGMNKVMQAVGRVIRTETDKGHVLLIDTRFRRPMYHRLFPPWWRPQAVRSLPS